MSTVAHPQTDGLSEAANKSILTALRALTTQHQRDWDLFLGIAVLGINASPHSGSGFSPFFMDTGRHPRLPADHHLSGDQLSNPAADRLEAIQSVWTSTQDRLTASRERFVTDGTPQAIIEPGDFVMVSSTVLHDPGFHPNSKLSPIFSGPFRVLAADNHTVTVQLPDGSRSHNRINRSHIKKATVPANFIPGPIPSTSSEPLYEVERILRHHKIPGSPKRRPAWSFLIRWKHYDAGHDSWEPEASLRDSTSPALHNHIDDYKARKGIS
jgi:hypothetical protein